MTPRTLSGYRHELVWMPGRLNIGRILAFAVLVIVLALWVFG
jgi:hypothetical protein